VSGLKRGLGSLEAAALSVAIMAPTAAMALNTSLAASVTGASVALSFTLATITIALVAYAFVTFARVYASAGSVYTFNGRALGARAGFLSGWTLILTYLTFTVASAAETGAFFSTTMSMVGVRVAWIWPALVCLAGILALCLAQVKLSTRVALVVEGVSIALIVVLAALITGHKGSAVFTATPFLPHGAKWSAIGLASVFGFLSFAGFAGAAVLGEETADPKRSIPRAIITGVATIGVFYVVIAYIQTVGFGLSPARIKEFGTSQAPLADLATSYAGHWFAVVLMAGATGSAFASAMGTTTGAARLLFTISKDGILPRSTARVSRFGIPATAVGVTVAIGTVGVIVMSLAGVDGATTFGYWGTVGVLALLVVYLVTQVAAIKLFGSTGRWRGPVFAVPVLAILGLGYALYANLWPVPARPYDLFPYLVLLWILLGVAVAFLRPHAVREAGASLAAGAAAEAD
jgi:amino acid transporter